MPEIKQPPIPRTLLITALIVFILALFGGAGIAYYLGAFTKPVVQRYQAPAYRIAFLPHTGPYNDIESTIEEAARVLEKEGIPTDAPCAVFLDEVSKVPREQLRSKVGYLVSPNAIIPGPLLVENLPARMVVRATFDGSTAIGSYKSYAAMREWASFHGYTLSLPALEIYHPDEGWVEYQLAISK